jgi:hypothetical protein
LESPPGGLESPPAGLEPPDGKPDALPVEALPGGSKKRDVCVCVSIN